MSDTRLSPAEKMQGCLTNPLGIPGYGGAPWREVSASLQGICLWVHAKHHREIFMTERHHSAPALGFQCFLRTAPAEHLGRLGTFYLLIQSSLLCRCLTSSQWKIMPVN